MPHLAVVVWLLLIVSWLTWTPVGSEPPRFLISGRLELRGLVGNLSLLAPLSVVATTAILASRTRPPVQRTFTERRTVAVVTTFAAVTSLLVELGQSMVPGRNVEILDVILNTTGGLLAALAATRALRYAPNGRLVSGVTAGTVFIAVLVFLVATGHQATQTMRLSDWDWLDSQLIAGDEVGGGRRYEGTVTGPFLCAGSTSNEMCASPGAEPEIRRRLEQTARRSQRVRLGATVTSQSNTQTGPTRLVSFSGSWARRNATLGQEGQSLHFRLRTRASGLNGLDIVFVLPKAIPLGVETRAIGEYRTGRVSLRSETDESVKEADYRWGFLNGWEILRNRPKEIDDPQRLLIGSVIAALALSLPIGILVAVLPTALTFRAPLAIFAPPVFVASIVWPLGGHLAPYELLWCALSGATGLLLSLGGQLALKRPLRWAFDAESRAQ